MRRRLIAAIATVAAVAVVLFAVPLAVVLQRAQNSERVLRLERDAVAATRALDVSADAGDDVELPKQPRQLAVYDRTGRRLDGRGGPLVADQVVLNAIATQRLADRLRDGRLVVAVPLVVDERVTGAVRVEAVVVHDGSTRWAIGGLAALVITLACAAAWLLGRRLSVPMERLAASAERLGRGDFSSSAPRAGVAELDAVAASLDQAAAQLDAMITRERSFSQDASHQLRTPLAAVRLELEGLELRSGATPESTAALAQVDRLQQTITTLLSVARDLPSLRTTCALDEVLAACGHRWQLELDRRGRELVVHGAPVGARAEIDERVLQEILDILIDNADRHGGGRITLRTRIVAAGVAVDVEDEGAGFPDAQQRLFARRDSAETTNGIGLPLARSLARTSAGDVVITRGGPGPVLTVLLAGAATG